MRVSVDERLTRLCADFSVVKIGEWLERKFASYDTSKADVISVNENKNDKEYFKSARLLGFVRDLPDAKGANRPLLVAAVEMRKILTERTSRQAQFNFAKRVLQNAVRGGAAGLNGYPSQGLFFFYDQDQFFRISLVSGEMDGRKFKFNEAKRQSFYINPDRPNNIAKSRLSEPLETFSKLKDAFSVETLTKEFYGKLFGWYEWAMKPTTGVTFPNDDSTPDDDRKYNNESIIRLITRLMFTWFIRQRDMVQSELFTVDGVKALLKSFDPKSMEEDNYYRCILQNLFFATFNCQPEKRGFIKHKQGNGYSNQHNVKTLYRYEKEFKDSDAFKALLKKTPFLNCALFDCLDKQQRDVDGGKLLLFDGFSDTRKRQAHVPNGLFFHPEKGIIQLFDTYEFTIDENNADDADVALDPELLGKVFENLLGAFNPETQETARKATGSFYTPREIVDYMVEESLKNHLKEKVKGVGQGQEWNARLDDLFDKTAAAEKRELPFDDDVAAEIREALYSCKILDPACGSGAFPMGILHCMVRLFGRLDPSNVDLNKRLIMRYKQETNLPPDPLETAAEREERLAALKVQLDEGQHYPDYARKLYLIENCIYGVDIQPIATQISKLRFFISLLCDQLRENWNADGENNGLLSLPNLEAKFVCANTLISLPKTEGELELMSCSKIPKLREKLQENRHRIFAARTFKQKEKLKARDLEIRDEIRETVRSTLAKPDEELIKIQEGIIAKLRKDRIPFETPKMVKQKKAVQDDFFVATQDTPTFEMVDVHKPKRDQIDAQIAFAKRKIDSELAKSSAANVTKIDQLATLVAGWDPYDQNASSSFFDPEWMFNISTGFDVVIGNPPYGKIFTADINRQVGEYFPVFLDTKDAFVAFILLAISRMSKGGVLQFIIPSSWHGGPSYRSLREVCLSNRILQIIELPFDMFSSAYVDTGIFGLQCVEPNKDNEVGVYRYHGRDIFDLSIRNNIEYVKQTHWLNVPDKKFILSESQLALELRLVDINGVLGDVVDAKRGVLLEKNAVYDTRIKGANFKYFVGDVYRYITRIESKWIEFGIGFKEGPKTEEWYTRERLLVRRLMSRSHRLMANIVDGSFVTNKNLYILRAKQNQASLRTILGVLNSRFYSYLYSSRVSGAVKDDFPQVTLTDLLSLPFVSLTSDMNARVSALVERILVAKKKDPNADTSALEAEIDQLVYKLYGLTEEEIAIVEGRGNEKAKGAIERSEIAERSVGLREESGSAKSRRRGARGRSAVVGATALPDDDEELE